MKYKTIDNKYNEFTLNIQKYFNSEENKTLFKKRNEIKLIEYKNNKYVIKSFKIPHFINKIVYRFFRESKAQRSYENSIKLLELGINTPKPIAYIEFSSLFFFEKSFYISEFFDYDFEIRAVIKDKEFEDRDNILKEFIKFTYELHNKGVYHVDYSPGNILIKKLTTGYEFYIIDVNRMKFLEFDIDLRMKSISKLTSNEEDNKLLISYYSSISGMDEDILSSSLNIHLDNQKRYLENKKKLKKMKG